VVCTDFEGLLQHFPPSSFDLITGFCVLEHVPDVLTALANCFELLKPGGWLAGTVPLVDSVQAQLFKARWNEVTNAPRHLSLPSREGLKHALNQVGFDRVSIRPDTTWNCAVLVGLSLFPGGLARYVYGGRRLGALLQRFLAGFVSLLAVPWCLVENYWLQRPALGMFLAQRPDVPLQTPLERAVAHSSKFS
jgi:SAM-dependent methyltransferase